MPVSKPTTARTEIKGLVETSFLDWPGQVSAVVFLGGCNFRCPFCHNHELVLRPHRLPGRPSDEIIEQLKPFAGWLDGVVVSGGEPTLDPGLVEMCWAVKKAGFKVKLDTNGTRPDVLKDLIGDGLVASFSMDLKAPLNEPLLHRRLAGVKADLAALRQSMDLLIGSGLEVIFRTTYVPGILREEHLASMAEEIRGAKRWSLNTFRPLTCLDEDFTKIIPLDEEEMTRLQKLADDLLAEA